MIEFIASKKLVFVAETKINRSIFFAHPKTKQQAHLRAEEIIPLIKQFYAHRLKHVEIFQQNGKVKRLFTYTIKSKLKDCSTPLQVFFIFDKWSDTDEKDVHILITNNPAMSVKTAINAYLLTLKVLKNLSANLKTASVLTSIKSTTKNRSNVIGLFPSWSGL